MDEVLNDSCEEQVEKRRLSELWERTARTPVETGRANGGSEWCPGK